MTLRSHRGEAQPPQHLQIRSLWPDAAPRPDIAPQLLTATRFAAHGRSSLSGQHTRSGLQTGRPAGQPAFTYTPGQPSPRVAGQHWEEQFRLKLVEAVKRRQRRAHLSIVLAGSGVLLVAAFFATLISLPYPDRDRSPAEMADAPSASVTSDLALFATVSSAPTGDAHAFRKPAGSTRFAALDVSDNDRGLLTALAPSGATTPVRNLSAIAELRPNASNSAPIVTRTRLRIVGDQISDPGAMIMVRGLPEGTSLSDGMSPTPGTWILGLESTHNLSIIAPPQYRGAFRAQLEIIAAGGVSLGQHEVDITLPAATIVVAMPAIKSGHPPRALPQKAAPQQHALSPTGSDRPSSTTVRAYVPEAKAAPQLAADDTASQSSTSSTGSSPRRTHAQPAYGLGGPR